MLLVKDVSRSVQSVVSYLRHVDDRDSNLVGESRSFAVHGGVMQLESRSCLIEILDAPY